MRSPALSARVETTLSKRVASAGSWIFSDSKPNWRRHRRQWPPGASALSSAPQREHVRGSGIAKDDSRKRTQRTQGINSFSLCSLRSLAAKIDLPFTKQRFRAGSVVICVHLCSSAVVYLPSKANGGASYRN